jgi:hypothetical protein
MDEIFTSTDDVGATQERVISVFTMVYPDCFMLAFSERGGESNPLLDVRLNPSGALSLGKACAAYLRDSYPALFEQLAHSILAEDGGSLETPTRPVHSAPTMQASSSPGRHPIPPRNSPPRDAWMEWRP